MVKIRKKDIALIRTIFLILLSQLSFITGFCVSHKIYSKRRNPNLPHIRSTPDKFFGLPQDQTAMFYSDN